MFDDREHWKGISDGDAEAFDTWYRETAPRLRAFLRHLTGSEHAADDLMQETYIQIWRRPQGFNSERGTARAYRARLEQVVITFPAYGLAARCFASSTTALRKASTARRSGVRGASLSR